MWLTAALTPGCYESYTRDAVASPSALRDALEAGPRRLAVGIVPGTRVAAEVRVLSDIALDDEERIGAGLIPPGLRSVELDGDCQGRLLTPYTDTLRFDRDRTFFFAEGESIECEAFVAAIRDAVVDERVPFVLAERPPPAEPAAPDDDTFRATEIEIFEDPREVDVIRVNADADNLLDCDALTDPAPGCFGVLRLLGADIVLTEAETQVEVLEAAVAGSSPEADAG